MKNLDLCIKAALAGGGAISDYKPTRTRTKHDIHVGHHAIVTSADYKSQKAILNELKSDMDSFFMTEEHVNERFFQDRLIKGKDLKKLTDSRVYIIDELDGSSGFKIGHYEWSISVGLLENLVHVAGAVYAPRINGGTLFYASLSNGAFIRGMDRDKQLRIPKRNLLDSYVIVGVDCFLKKYPIHNKLVHKLADECRTVNSNGSCALPLGLVAAGRADALVQPVQSPWDWAAGKLIVEEAGGKVLFYEQEGNKMNFLEKLEAKHYNPNERSVGFIAANKSLADQIKDILLGLRE